MFARSLIKQFPHTGKNISMTTASYTSNQARVV